MTAATPHRWRTPDGLTLAGDSMGPPGAPAVVLLHGGGQTRHSWSAAMRSLAALGHYVVSYDARGHGDSDWSPAGSYGMPALAADLGCVLAGIPGPVALVGASLGGLTAFYAIGAGRGRVADALVLADVVPRPTAHGSGRVRAFMSGHRDGFASLDEAAAAIAAFNPGRRRPPSHEGLRRNLRLRADGRYHWHYDPRVVEQQTPDRADLLLGVSAGVRVPLLLVRGERSDVIDDAGVEELRRHVPHLEVRTLRGAGHMVTGDHNDTFLHGVADFLDRHLVSAG
jgi:pimeloyl-ACP methyl ester carboxylesterase